MIQLKPQKTRTMTRRLWQATFALLLCAVILTEAAPELTASAFSRIADGISTLAAPSAAEPVDAERILVFGAETEESDVALEGGRKVTIRRGEEERYATSRDGERVSELLRRENVSVGALEMVRVDLTEENILIEIASGFTYYETETEEAAYGTTYVTDYTLAKGETRVKQAGRNGTRDVVYEVVYADGAFVSRQAVAEGKSTAEDEVVSVGTLVKEAQPGDTIASVVRYEDGSGYLLLKSGDSLHFTGSMEVKCTAYTTGDPGVGTITATGTTVHVGVVAVDKSVIPLGTLMFITTTNGDYTYGMGHAEDTGVRGKSVDLYMNTYEECIQFGRRSSIVYFLDN